MDRFGNLALLLLLFLTINLGAIIKLKNFSNISRRALRKILIVTNIVLIVYYIAYFFVLKRGNNRI